MHEDKIILDCVIIELIAHWVQWWIPCSGLSLTSRPPSTVANVRSSLVDTKRLALSSVARVDV